MKKRHKHVSPREIEDGKVCVHDLGGRVRYSTARAERLGNVHSPPPNAARLRARRKQERQNRARV